MAQAEQVVSSPDVVLCLLPLRGDLGRSAYRVVLEEERKAQGEEEVAVVGLALEGLLEVANPDGEVDHGVLAVEGVGSEEVVYSLVLDSGG